MDRRIANRLFMVVDHHDVQHATNLESWLDERRAMMS